jgi:translin
MEFAPYLNGLGEAVGELRRYILDALRRDDLSRCEELLGVMDEVYTILVTMDFPDAITGGLRRTTDMVRGVLERTRGDLTAAVRQRALEQRLAALERRSSPDDEPMSSS